MGFSSQRITTMIQFFSSACVCVNHLKRCKTSILVETRFSFPIFCPCHHYILILQGVPGALTRPAPATKPLISCLRYRWGRSSTYLRIISISSWAVANPRTTLSLFVVMHVCRNLGFISTIFFRNNLTSSALAMATVASWYFFGPPHWPIPVRCNGSVFCT